ncbi:HEPN domain-containing protein [Marinomonas agarivorans]|nr:HEPN domain-containing protein [Marinomonas agarivorans]
MDSLSNFPLRRMASQRIPASLTSLSFPYSSLAHLPVTKREQLQQAVGIILSAISPAKPAMIMLFGSYARGDWLQTAEYESSFDIWLIMAKAPLVQKVARKESLYKRLQRDVETPVHVLVEDVQGIERRIGKGQWIYTDRLQESIVLYGSGIHSFTHFSRLSFLQKQQASQKEPQTSHRKQKASHRKQKAGADFRYWFAKANVYRVYAKMAMQQGDYNEAAFFLHQSVERFYATVLWVFGGYSSSSHDLQQLHQLVASIAPQFLRVFPQKLLAEKAMFEQLRQAYVEARYKPSFSMGRSTLEWLLARVHLLKQLTEGVCQARIARYC